MAKINTTTEYGWLVSNYTNPQTVDLVIGNASFIVTENYITPTGAGVTINGASYALPAGSLTTLPGGFYVSLEGIQSLPIETTVTLALYKVPTAQSANTTAANVTTAVTTVPTTTVAPVTTTVIPTTSVIANTTGGGRYGSTPIPPILPIGVGALIAILAGYYVLGRRRRRKR